MTLLQEIALEMSIKTGQVYTCPAENLIQGPDHAYYIRPRTWPKPERLCIDITGPENKSPYKTETITLDPNRKPQAIAADILRRLPPTEAKAYYSKAIEYIEKRNAEKAKHAAAIEEIEKAGFKCHQNYHEQATLWKDHIKVEVYNGNVSYLTLRDIKLTDMMKIMEILNPKG